MCCRTTWVDRSREVGSGRKRVEEYLLKCCEANGLLADDGLAQCRATLASGINAGMRRPYHDIDGRGLSMNGFVRTLAKRWIALDRIIAEINQLQAKIILATLDHPPKGWDDALRSPEYLPPPGDARPPTGRSADGRLTLFPDKKERR